MTRTTTSHRLREKIRQREVTARSESGNDIGALAESRVRRDGSLATRCVSCSYHEGVLTLHGIVPTYYLKQVAQTAVMRIDGVERVDNQIEVR